MRRSTRAGRGIFLRIPELVEAVLVDPEVVGELVQDGDPDLLLELLRVGERRHERPPEDRDLVGHVVRRLPQPEQVRVVRVLLLDHDRDVLEGARELPGDRVERPPHVLLEPHRRDSLPLRVRGPSGGRTWNARIATSPNTNPPTCAANATPPDCCGCVTENPDCQSWSRNQTIRKKPAESRHGRKPKSSVTTRACGSSTRYAPSTAAIAPLAPTFGTLAAAAPAQWRVT